MIKVSKPDWIGVVWIVLWTLWNGLILTRFPHAHSDEAWLAGLSNAYRIQGTIRVTEPFFDLFPRQAHAFKIFFHGAQAVMIEWFGMNLTAVRLLSLVTALGILIVVYLSTRNQLNHRWLPLVLTAGFSLQPLFITAAHIARQEILILGVLILAQVSLDHLLEPRLTRQGKPAGAKWPLIQIAVLISFSALLHPNALIVALMIGLQLLLGASTGRVTVRQLSALIVSLILAAAMLIGLSIWLSPGFLSQYATYGASLSVDAGFSRRLANLVDFFRMLRDQDTGTYWLPALGGWLTMTWILAAASAVGLVAFRQWIDDRDRRRVLGDLAGLAGWILALFIIGRYNPTSVLFGIWPVFRLLSHWLGCLPQFTRPLKWGTALSAAALPLAVLYGIGSLISSLQGIDSVLSLDGGYRQADPFATYQAELVAHLPEQAIVLGNLSAGFALTEAAGAFYDIRNLPYASQMGLDGIPVTADESVSSVESYLRTRHINTVIWYEEYDYILRNPAWWVLYDTRPGLSDDPSALMALKQLIDRAGTVRYSFESPVYGTRIVRYQGDYPWQISLIEIDLEAICETPSSP